MTWVAACNSSPSACGPTGDSAGVSAGMAGSGKTTLLQRLNSELHIRKTPGYIINLDPAVLNVPYSPNVDIRDTVCMHALHMQRACSAQGA